MELDITLLANAIGDSVTAERFTKASQARKKAISSILWNAEMQQWLDYRLTDSVSSEVNIYSFVCKTLSTKTETYFILLVDQLFLTFVRV